MVRVKVPVTIGEMARVRMRVRVRVRTRVEVRMRIRVTVRARVTIRMRVMAELSEKEMHDASAYLKRILDGWGGKLRIKLR